MGECKVNSDTPRTDALVDARGKERILPNDRNATGWSSLDTSAFIELTYQLERELNSALAELDQLKREQFDLIKSCTATKPN